MKSELRIETPEGIVFSFVLASPVSRWLAWLLDAAIVATAGRTAGEVLQGVGLASVDWANALTVLAYFVFMTLYAMTMEWFWRGQTIGKRLFRLRVIDGHGLHLTFSQVALRNLLRAVDGLPFLYLVGGVAALCSSRARRLGDLAANTVVVRETVPEEPDLERMAPAKYNSLASHPYLVARLRSGVRREAATLGVQALLHRDQYDPQARLALFGELADYFRAVVRFPDEATEGLTDEQYVRSVLGVLYPVKRNDAAGA